MKAKLAKYNNKFNIDVLWNFGGFVLAGLIFVIINLILLFAYDEAVVGVFGMVFAIYMLIAQLAVAGMHLSVQMFVPKYVKSKAHTDVVLTAALVTAFVVSGLITGICYLFHELPGEILQSEAVKEAFQYVLWGLVFFSLNKVLLAYHNGYRRMKAFAFFQFLRITVMLAVLLFFIFSDTDNTNLIPSLLAISEFVVFFVLFGYTLKFFTPTFGRRTRAWIKIHFRYGMKALPGNFLLDANARVDVIMLGYFLSDERVGVYSFALTFAEGMLQIPMIFRNNMNPILTKARNMTEHNAILNKLLRKNVIAFYKIITPLAIVSIFLFPLGLWLIGVEEFSTDYWIVYSILVGAISLSAGYLPFQMLFNQLGMPGMHSLFIFIVFATNCIGNLIFIQYYGIFGAAMGTALAIFMQAIMLRILVRVKTPYRI
jgi:O-antigen/teichoic acid export membrane protein